MAGRRSSRKGATRRRATLIAVAAVFAVAVALAPLQAALLRVFDPPLTVTMLVRAWQHWRGTGRFALPEYRWVDLGKVSPGVVDAAITSEDQRFFQHHGFDVGAIERAWQAYGDDENGKLRGGSTISQQVARNVFLWQGRTWLRKGIETWYTVWLELLNPKRRILEVYLNVAETAPMTFGIEAAARRYFDKSAARLTPGEAARIVACLPAPRRWTPSGGYVQRRAAWIVRHAAKIP